MIMNKLEQFFLIITILLTSRTLKYEVVIIYSGHTSVFINIWDFINIKIQAVIM